MQSLYALHQKGSDDWVKEEKFLLHSVDAIVDLYLLLVSALIEIRNKEADFIEKSKNKFLATEADKNPDTRFVDHPVFACLEAQPGLQQALEDRRISYWQRNDDAIIWLHQEVKQSAVYAGFMQLSAEQAKADWGFVARLFEQVIAPSEKLYAWLEDHKLTWLDDLALVNTELLKQLQKLGSKKSSILIPEPFKDEEDREYTQQLFRKTLLNDATLGSLFIGKTPNWDIERIADIDTILIKMALCELVHFPTIPVKVTLNEYVEIAKEYSTPKSSVFINGLLDHLVKTMKDEGKVVKLGRGLKE